jgi:hypothetical protein
MQVKTVVDAEPGGEARTRSFRQYEPRDQAAVRRICCDTAVGGRPLEEWLDVDRELFADLFTLYYCRYEPELSWVVEQDGEVVGYLQGCADTRHYGAVMTTRVVPRILWRVLVRRYTVGRRTWRTVCYLAADALQGRLGSWPWREYPAHFHLNIVPKARDAFWTTGMLIDRFQTALLRRGIRRYHIQMLSHRVNLRRKFEMLNFRVWSMSEVRFRPSHRGRPACFATFVRELDGTADPVDTGTYRMLRRPRS